MTAYYIDSNASGGNDGTSWTDAYATVTTALSGKVAGDIFYTASNHSESTAGQVVMNFPASSDLNPVVFISSSTAASPPTTFTRGAKIANSGALNDITWGGANNGHAVFIGFDFASIDNLQIAADTTVYLYDCICELTGTVTDVVVVSNVDTSFYAENTEFKFGGVTQYIQCKNTGLVELVNCKIASGSSAINVKVFDLSQSPADIIVRGFDASNAAAGVDLINPIVNPIVGKMHARFSGIKMPTSWSGSHVAVSVPDALSRYETYVLDDDTDTIHKVYIDSGAGTVRSETTTVHTGTYDGTSKYSLAITNDAVVEECIQPMYVKVAEMWAAANLKFTVRVTSDSTLTDQDFWISVKAPDSTSGALQNFGNTRNANYFLGSGTTLTAGSGWTSPKTNQYEVEYTVTGSQAGVHEVTASLASDAALTVYVDPNVTVTNA